MTKTDRDRAGRFPTPALVILATLFFSASAAIFLIKETSSIPDELASLILGFGTIALYGGLAVVLLIRKDVDAGQVRVFTLLAVLVTATIVLAPIAPGTGPSWLFVFLFVLYTLVFLVNPAVVVHMAALIPHPHRILERRRWFLPMHYASFFIIGLVIAAWLLWLINQPSAQAVTITRIKFTANVLVYLYAGIAVLVLLGGAARQEPASRGRRQALMVFFGVLPWTAVLTARLILPFELQSRLPLDVVEKAVIFFVPVTMFIAIVGFRMFGLELLMRRGLIYGLTLGIPLVILVGVWLAVGVFASRALGFEATPLNVGLVLLMVGVVLRPLAKRITAEVDRMFFPEKIALRRLPRAVIGEFAAHTDLDEAAGRLVHRLKNELQVRNVALLVIDDEHRFFRVRAEVREYGESTKVSDVVLKAEDLARRPELLQGRPISRLMLEESMTDEWGAMRDRLGADTVVPVTLGGPPTALICLGRPLAGGYFDKEDLAHLEILAEQVAAVIEHARVQELARIDPLTRLPRRQVALDRLEEELKRGHRSGRAPAVAIADIDNFKSINDRHGHPIGDRALRAVSDALRNRARSIDLVARYGGEEMIIVFPECDAEGAAAVCDSMLRAVRETVFRGDKDQPLSVSVSIGVAVAVPQDTAESLISRADKALYRAKRTGKDRVCMAESP